MNYICLDLWNKRVGVAVNTWNIAFPKDIVVRTDIVKYVRKYLKEHTIDAIVIGLPYDLYGKDLRQLEKTQDFIEKLKNIFPTMDIIWHDERFTSFVASEGYNDHRDDVAAQCILQSYLDTNRT